ncbi:PREDICTED: nuclear pore complex protein Nup50 [Poecilia mexicana]|uniref:Nuclear pore complex protein Nup50 n=1 Tax=Poecilia mexicana TaxID=48701 RepID=A0A3B3YBE5_9TELE|nr:PREDICTED: nuclear pore complex protein Nup50 [Poecilia mexicana]XP_014827637.1 PREDICTED: nuclear pore complex protein Nup50 [Poecilia mexicana]
MAKRIADKELTDRNWDQEEEGEEAGTFSVASEDVLKNRAIKKAKRRNTGGESEGGGAFKGFKGFSMAAPSTTPSSSLTAFSGFGGTGSFKGFGGLSNGTGSTPSFSGFPSAAKAGVAFNGPSSAQPGADIAAQQTNGSAPGPSPAPCSRSREYSRQLTALNQSVRDWISKHVNDNPLCDLNPIFRDYERHLASIERQYGAGVEETQQGDASTPSLPAPSLLSSSSSSSSVALFSFSKTSTEDPGQKRSGSAPLPAGVSFNFGQKVDAPALGSLTSKPSVPSFSFSSSSNQSSPFGSAGPSAALSFGGTKTSDAPAADDKDEESEEPPKPEVKEVKEDDAFYSKKCKLFYKKESEFKEKGVGTLHLKRTAEGKTQMIVRADTNLGNILLNILVPSTLPCSRVGKNNVMVVCVPNPPVDDKNPSVAVPLLIRVKTAEDADELHKTLEEKKG